MPASDPPEIRRQRDDINRMLQYALAQGKMINGDLAELLSLLSSGLVGMRLDERRLLWERLRGTQAAAGGASHVVTIAPQAAVVRRSRARTRRIHRFYYEGPLTHFLLSARNGEPRIALTAAR